MLAAPQALIDLFQPWNDLYSGSKALTTIVTYGHLASMLFGGGLAVAADRRTLRTRRDSSDVPALLAELQGTHRPVVTALAGSFLTGAAMAAADVETFLASPIFLVKLALVALLLANGALLLRAEQALRRPAPPPTDPASPGPRPASPAKLWGRLRRSAWASLILWASTALVGTILVNAA